MDTNLSKRLRLTVLFSGLLFGVLCRFVSAQAVPVSAAIVDGSNNPVPGAYLHFDLYNCGPNYPTLSSLTIPGNVSTGTFHVGDIVEQSGTLVTATLLSIAPFGIINLSARTTDATDIWIDETTGAIFTPTGIPAGELIVQRSFDLQQNSNGLISGTVVPNDLIRCGNQVSTQWTVTPMKGGATPLNAAQRYFVCSLVATGTPPCAQTSAGATFDPSTAQPAQTVPQPPGYSLLYANPVATQGITQPAGTEFNWLGTVNFCSATVLCGGSGGGEYQTIEDNGTAETPRPTLNLIPGTNQTISCVDNSGQNRTDCTWSSSGSGTGTVNPGVTGEAAYYPSSAAAVSPQSNLTFSGTTSSFPNGPVQIGASPPTACGTATGCLATPTSSGTVAPVSGQNSFRFSGTQMLCSINGGTEAACGSGGSGITGSGTANTFPLWTGTSTQGNSNLTAVTSPNGINYSVGSGLSVQLDASDLLFNSGIVGSSNILIANSYNPGANSNAGGIAIQGAPTSGSACAGGVTISGGQVSSSSGNASMIVNGGCANGFGAIGEDITLTGGTGGGGNGNGKIVMNDHTSTFTQSGGNAVETGMLTASKLNVSFPCASAASPAVCASAALGFVAIPTGTNPTLVINTTTVTATSRIFLQNDATLGTALGITCNSTGSTLAIPAYVSARTGGTSFTIAYSGTVSTNSLCLSYEILN